MRYLKVSSDYYGVDLTLLKYNKEWTGHRLKDALLKKYLEKLNGNEIVMCTDAYDTLFLGDTDTIKSRFLKFNKPILFSAERNCWPEPALSVYYKKNGFFRYLNSGAFIGESKTILRLMNRYKEPPAASFNAIRNLKIEGLHVNKYYNWSNQYYWSLIYLKHRDLIALDHNHNIFYTLTTGLDRLRKYYGDFLENGKNAKIYKSEVKRIKTELVRINTLCSKHRPLHLHFNSPIVQSVFQNEDLSDFFEWQ